MGEWVRREPEQETIRRYVDARNRNRSTPPELEPLLPLGLEGQQPDKLYDVVAVVTGGRNFHNWELTYRVLDRVHRLRRIKALVCGMAPGLDSMSARWAQQRGVPLIAAPADWKRFGKAAGVLRNEAMLVDHEPHVCIAFPGGRGTADCVRRVKARGIPLLVVEE